MSTKNNSRRSLGGVPLRLFVGREVLAVFVFFLISSSAAAGALPGQLLVLPAYFVMVGLDIFENTVFSLGNGFSVVLVALFYLLSVVIAAGYRAIRT